MSFITKRERVFNEYDLFDLPARNEGKLKAYASCTDSRAWSHFCTDKSEHLVEVIKRNNETVRPKYLPTNVIVDTLMVAKNTEIARLKQRIQEFEQMLTAYDQLDLSCDQKCEIANAHAAIRAANKELDDMCLDLDLSGFTEGLDSEAFQTGKSRGDGDEIISPIYETKDQEVDSRTETKAVQMGTSITSEVGTNAIDPRIDEMQDVIISKDAKLNAMKNTIAVMENDVCEPYCIYAHIYTALEKIFGILCQNEKYRQYLNLLTAGKDIRCINVQGKILFKLKVLEKFCIALIAPCNREFNTPSVPPTTNYDCECYRAELTTCIEANFAMTSAEATVHPNIDCKRAHLVADIIQNDEMKEILSKDSFFAKQEEDLLDDGYIVQDYNIEMKNLSRLKKLQEDYDDLMNCYETLKHEKEGLETRCKNYEELEKEFANLKLQIQEYNSLWSEKEHYRKRSADLDHLKEQYFILTDETANLETQLKAESEINKIKSTAIDDIRNENLHLEKKLNEAHIAFDKEKKILLCRLKEADCRIMCQEQQIKSLKMQIDRLLEQDQQTLNSPEGENNSVVLIDEIETYKEQINNLKDALFCNEEETQNLQQQYQNQLQLINELKMQVEEWKDAYQKTLQRNDSLEKYTKFLSQDSEEKSKAVENLLNVIDNKSQEINKLTDETVKSQIENRELHQQINELQSSLKNSIETLKNEKFEAQKSLNLAREESQELLEKLKDYDEVKHLKANATESLEVLIENKKQLENLLKDAVKENKSLKVDLQNSTTLLQENQRLQEVKNSLQNENIHYKTSIELVQKESKQLKLELVDYEMLSQQFKKLQEIHKALLKEKENLENLLLNKNLELDNLKQSIYLTKRKSEELMDKLQESEDFKQTYNELLTEKNGLQNDLKSKEEEFNKLYDDFEKKIEENQKLYEQIKDLQLGQIAANSSIQSLQDDNLSTLATLSVIKKESAELIDKLRQYELLETEFERLKRAHEQTNLEKENLQTELKMQLNDLKRMERENTGLHSHSQNLISHNESLENALISSRTELIVKSISSDHSHKDILLAVEKLKQEKLVNKNKIRDLLNKLDETENLISNLNEDLLARNDRITILENHINDLKDEIRKLHINLDQMVDTGERITEFSNQKIDSIRNIEAHHSKATHNMKLGLVELKQHNLILEEQLSASKRKSEESLLDISRFESQITKLQNEREIIVTDIKQLELKSVGGSVLGPKNCEVEDILSSLARIKKYLDARNSKILKVQTSSQLLLSKADEAKRLVEKEKQKVISEKEDAIRDRLNMENQLWVLKEKLEKQIANDKIVITDLESTIENQKLIIEKINNSSSVYISKLKEEMKNLQDLYQNSVKNINELQGKLHTLTDDRNTTVNMLNEIKEELEGKVVEIYDLQKELQEIKNKSIANTGTQTKIKTIFHDASTQIEKELVRNIKVPIEYENDNSNNKESKSKELSETENFNVPGFNQLIQLKKHHEPQTKHNESQNNDVQILTVNVEPTFDYVKNIYMTYKAKCLSQRKLEHYSISNFTDSEINEDCMVTLSPKSWEERRESFSNTNLLNPNLIDIYNRHSMDTNSSKVNNVSDNTTFKGYDVHSLAKNDVNSPRKDNASITSPSSRKTPEKGLFVIFNDSTESSINKNQKSVKNATSYSEAVNNKENLENNEFYYKEEDIDDNERDILIKQRLEISVPRVEKDSISLINTSDGDKNSFNSDLALYYPSYDRTLSDTKICHDGNSQELKSSTSSLPINSNLEPDKYFKSQSTYIEASISKALADSDRTEDKYNISKTNDKVLNIFDKGSNHKLSRVEANALLLNIENGVLASEDTVEQRTRAFGRQYIIDTVQGEVDPDNINNSNYFRTNVQSVKSDETLNLVKTSADNVARQIDLNLKSSYILRNSKLRKTVKRSQKTFADCSVMVRMDTTTEHETIIESLTKQLENIEKDYKKKIEAIKIQYDSNIKNIINEHNQGVKSIQGLHEDSLKDIKIIHENEVENLRSMSFEAMRKAEKLEKENKVLKTKVHDRGTVCLDEEPIKMPTLEQKRRRKSRGDSRLLTKTIVEAFNVKPNARDHGLCTCSLDVNVADTIRNIFEQVDVEQNKIAETTYMKYIINKMINGNVEALDAHELSFLHLKVCRIWKAKLTKEEALQKSIDSLKSEINKQRNTQENFAELDRKVAEERRRLQEVREAVCRTTSQIAQTVGPVSELSFVPPPPPLPNAAAAKDFLTGGCNCNKAPAYVELNPRGSAGDLFSTPGHKRRAATRTDANRGIIARLDVEERREKKLYKDEAPTRLRRSHERQTRSKM